MKLRDYLRRTAFGARLVDDKRYRLLVTATVALIFNLGFAFYHGILGFFATAVYYVLLAVMRFVAVVSERRDKQTSSAIGILLIALSVVFDIMFIFSMINETAAVYGTIPMISIATYTFTKITAAAVSGIKHRNKDSAFVKTINAIRYSEIAVSLLTMQQSMLVSFGEGDDGSSVILNALTGGAVCFFILAVGIMTFKKQ